jgi:hypothetical protein
MKKIFQFIFPVFACHILMAQPSEYYKQVDQIVWVINDLDAVLKGWSNLGFEGIIPGESFTTPGQEYKGKMVDIKMKTAFMNFGGKAITFIQPEKGKNAYYDFLKKHGDGAMVLMHRAPSLAEINCEVDRMAGIGVNVLQRGSFQQGSITINYVFFDSQKSGKYVLGLYDGAEVPAKFLNTPNALNMTFSQFAFAINDPAPVSAFWKKLGFPELEVTHSESWDKEYYGVPSDFQMDLGWQRHGKIVYEWCIPLKPPTVYADHIKNHGEGIQHFGMNVSDMDKAIAFMTSKGFKVSQSGGWGEKGKKGSGRFAYIDTEGIGGETIELLWNFKE